MNYKALSLGVFLVGALSSLGCQNNQPPPPPPLPPMSYAPPMIPMMTSQTCALQPGNPSCAGMPVAVAPMPYGVTGTTGGIPGYIPPTTYTAPPMVVGLHSSTTSAASKLAASIKTAYHFDPATGALVKVNGQPSSADANNVVDSTAAANLHGTGGFHSFVAPSDFASTGGGTGGVGGNTDTGVGAGQ